jgi:OOP family OmpA-OmpF porin
VDEYGCPPDADGDSVADSLDHCPDTRPGVRVDSKGCDLDLDGDGVPYYRDRCQLTPQGARVNAEGCAEKMLVQDAMLPAGDVLFGFDRTDLTPAARTLLQDVAQSLKQRSDANSLLITGHTDSTGPAAYNQSLSEARAASVQRYLQEQAVNMRMRSQGQGESKPIASNDSREGRRQNRRVEIDVGATPE